MAKNNRRQHSSTLKSKVAIDAIRGVNTVPEIARKHEVHPSRVSTWKKQLLEGAAGIFADGDRGCPDQEELIASLYEQVGRLQVELQWLKKKSGCST